MVSRPKVVNIFIVSDATGATAKSVLTSVLVQYPRDRFNLKTFPFTRTRKQVEAIVEQAPQGDCVVIFTLVSAKLREILIETCLEKKLTAVDIMGPIIDILSDILKHTPRMQPGKLDPREEDIYRLAAPIKYTLTHDDGLGVETLGEADLIILGVSRTGKTPTSIFLSCRNLKVANIPIVCDQPLPADLARLPAKKIGFNIEAERLIHLRAERTRRMAGGSIPSYSERSFVLRELAYCDEVFSRIPRLHTIDVTNRSIEEISEWITRYVL